MTGWHTLDALNVRPGDEVRHILGTEHTITEIARTVFRNQYGFEMRGDLPAWDIVRRAAEDAHAD